MSNTTLSRPLIQIDGCRGKMDLDVQAGQLSEGIIYIIGEVNEASAYDFEIKMMEMARQKKDVKIILNSPGGEVVSGLMIYDIIQDYPYGVDIYCTGLAASMGAVILCSGRKGHRFVNPHAEIMIHEPLMNGGTGGSATSIQRTAENIIETKKVLNGIIAKHTGKTVKEIDKETAFDNYMTADEAIKFGLCDEKRSPFAALASAED